MYKQDQVLVAGVETGGYGVEPATLDGSMAILVSDLNVKLLDATTKERNNYVGHMGSQGSITVARKAAVSFGVEVAGSGAAATPPGWGLLLRGCGMNEVIGASDVTYSCVGDSFESLAFLYRLQKVQQKILGIRGKVAFNFDIGSIPMFKFDYEGLYQEPTVEADILTGVDVSAFNKPVGATSDSMLVSLFGAPVRTSKLNIDLGNIMQFDDYTDQRENEQVGRKSKLATTIRTTDAELVDYITKGSTNAEGAFNAVLKNSGGNDITVDSPNIQVTKATPSWNGEVATIDIEADIKPLTANTDLTITQSAAA